MSTVRKYEPHYTVEDYQHWDGDWELWHGTAVAMSPSPFGGHASIVAEIVYAFVDAIKTAKCHAKVLVEIDWVVSNDTVLRPDAVVVCGDAPQRHVESVPAIVVEVLSDSTRDRDLHWKREIYQEQKVPHYFILDPVVKQILWLRLNESHRFESRSVTSLIEVDLCDTCSIQVSTDRLFQ